MPPFVASAGAKAAHIFAGLTFRLVLIGLIVLMLVNTYADIRIPIPLLPDIHYEGWKPKAQRLQHTIDEFDKAQKEAGRLAQAALEAKEREYRNLAERIDDEHERAESAAMGAADRFIAANRVRTACDRSTPGATVASPEGGGARVPESVPTDSLVGVTDADVRACSAATAYAVKAHDWAVTLAD